MTDALRGTGAPSPVLPYQRSPIRPSWGQSGGNTAVPFSDPAPSQEPPAPKPLLDVTSALTTLR